MSTGLFDHLPQKLRIFKHRTRTQMIAVEGLALVVHHKQGTLEDLQDALIMDVGIGEVDEYAGLRVAAGIDMEVVSSSGDAAAYILAIVLEVHGIELDIALIAADIADPVDHVLSLLRCRHKGGNRVLSDRHIVEIETELGAFFLQQMEEIIAGYRFHVLAGVAYRSSEQDPVLFQKIHSTHNFCIMTGAAAGIVGIRRAFDRKQEGHVSQTNKLLAEIFIDQRRVGESCEIAVMMLFDQTEQILFADHGLAARHQIKVNAQFFTFRYDFVHVFERQVVFVAVGTGPAADAVHVASRCRIEQDQPRNVAVIFFTVFTDHLGAAKEGFVTKVQKRHLCEIRIDLIDRPVDELHPAVVRIGNVLLNFFNFFRRKSLSKILLGKSDYL